MGTTMVVSIGFVLLVSLAASASAHDSHYVTYTYTVSVFDRVDCRVDTYTYCQNWYFYPMFIMHSLCGCYAEFYLVSEFYHPCLGISGRFSICSTQQVTSCYNVYRAETRTATKCLDNWTGSACNIPVCNNPSCSGGQVCVDVNKCECLDSNGRNCILAPCNSTNNCYPGTCRGTKCSCPNGFAGSNCEQIKQKPTIGECYVKLFASINGRDAEVAKAYCAAEGLTPSTTWVSYGVESLAKIELHWESTYIKQFTMQPKPADVNPFYLITTPVQIGVASAKYSISFPGYTTQSYECKEVRIDSPQTSAKCTISSPWNEFNLNPLVKQNASFTVNMMASLGGQKIGDRTYSSGSAPGYYDFTHDFVGDTALVQANFRFDPNPPTHCLLIGNDHRNCSLFPIWIGQDVRTNEVIEPKFIGWSDDISGINIYHVEVFRMKSDDSDLLTEIGNPLATADVRDQLNNFKFMARNPGVYSIVLTVYDQANNTAMARKIFNFNDQPSFRTTDAPVYIKDAFVDGNISYVTNLQNLQTLTLTWAGRFQRDPQYASEFSKAVKPWETSPTKVDDNFGTKFGMRSIAAARNITGISSIMWAYVLDTEGGGIKISEPGNRSWTRIEDTTEDHAELRLDNAMKDGDALVIWLKAIDAAGNPSTVTVKAVADTTPVQIGTDPKFVKNGVDKYKSKFVINCHDKSTGIKSIDYEIIDERSGASIHKGQAPPTTRIAPSRKRDTMTCSQGDPTCYCTPFRECFNYDQIVTVDHCLIDRFAGEEYRLQLKFKISNKANLNTTERIVEFGDINGIKCRPTKLSDGAIAGIVIACIIGIVLICLLIFFILLLWRSPERRRRYTERFSRTIQTVRRFTMKRPRETENVAYAEAQPPPPPYPGPSDAYDNKSPVNDKKKLKPAIVDDDEDDDVFVQSDGRRGRLLDVVDEGKFAVIRRAELSNGKKREVVAAKMLKEGYTPVDEEVMLEKIKFLKRIPASENVIRFVDAVTDVNRVGGPFMLLELCEISMDKWLTSRRSYTADDLEAVAGFALGIAKGVQHLHSCKIVHRRLAASNVLLRKQRDQYVVKLVGFCPKAEDLEGQGAKTTARIKWLAPETLNTLGKSTPAHYDQKTDSWSYAIAVWEMYSLGKAPYDGISSTEIKSKLEQGHRLTRPTACPPQLFTSVLSRCWNADPDQRPTFSVICREITKFRADAGGKGGYYGVETEDEGIYVEPRDG